MISTPTERLRKALGEYQAAVVRADNAKGCMERLHAVLNAEMMRGRAQAYAAMGGATEDLLRWGKQITEDFVDKHTMALRRCICTRRPLQPTLWGE